MTCLLAWLFILFGHHHAHVAAPTFSDCAPRYTYTVPASRGVIYDVQVNGGVFHAETAGVYPASAGMRVTVEALTGPPEAPGTRQLGLWAHQFLGCVNVNRPPATGPTVAPVPFRP